MTLHNIHDFSSLGTFNPPQADGNALIARTAQRDTAYDAAVTWLYAGTAPEASEGNGIEIASQVAATLYRFDVTPQQCGQLLAEWNENFCSPPLAADEIGNILDSAPRNPQPIDSAKLKAPPSIPVAAAAPNDTAASRAVDLNSAPVITKRDPASSISRLQAARDHVRRGFRVFPIAHNAKDPPLFRRFTEFASQDDGLLRRWFDQPQPPNIALVTDEIVVIDVDPRNGGQQTLQKLRLTEDFPPTLGAQTAGGGCHMFYRLPTGMKVKGKTHALGDGVDVKARGGYVVGAGSEINGKAYAWLNDIPPADAPAWVLEALEQAQPAKPNAGKRLGPESPEGVALAEKYVKERAPEAAEGYRDDTCFEVAARVYDYGVTRQTAELLLTDWNFSKCSPPLEPSDIARIAASAERNRREPIGMRDPNNACGFEPFIISKQSQAAHDERVAKLRAAKESDESGGANKVAPTFAPVAPFDPLTLPRRPWIIPNLACRNVVTLIAGPGGVAKSTWTLQVAIAAVTGRSDVCGFVVPKRARVLVWNQEDDLQEMHRRLAAIMQAFEVSWDDLKDEAGETMLFLGSGVDAPLMLAQRRGDGVAPGQDVKAFMAAVRDNAIDTVILDPLVELHQASENDNVEMRQVLGVVRQIAKTANCAAVVVTHVKKPDKARTDGFAGDMDSARGASSQSGISRIGLTVYNAQKSDDKHWKFDGSSADYVRVDIGKNNLGARSKAPMWFKVEKTIIGGMDGESAAILRPVSVKPMAAAKSARPNVLVEIAGAISKNREACDGKNLSVIESYLSADALATLPAKKHRAAAIDAAFDGALEYMTDIGTLKRENRRGKVGWVYCLASAPMLPKGNTGNSK